MPLGNPGLKAETPLALCTACSIAVFGLTPSRTATRRGWVRVTENLASGRIGGTVLPLSAMRTLLVGGPKRERYLSPLNHPGRTSKFTRSVLRRASLMKCASNVVRAES